MDIFKKSFFLICTDENADVICFSECSNFKTAKEAMHKEYASVQARLKGCGISENEFIPRFLSDNDAVIFWEKGKKYLRLQVQDCI